MKVRFTGNDAGGHVDHLVELEQAPVIGDRVAIRDRMWDVVDRVFCPASTGFMWGDGGTGTEDIVVFLKTR